VCDLTAIRKRQHRGQRDGSPCSGHRPRPRRYVGAITQREGLTHTVVVTVFTITDLVDGLDTNEIALSGPQEFQMEGVLGSRELDFLARVLDLDSVSRDGGASFFEWWSYKTNITQTSGHPRDLVPGIN
jgi:hypothetical protein